MKNKEISLTGDRPTGALHYGHYVGSLKNRVLMQSDNSIDERYVMIADLQGLTDNADNPSKISENIINVMLDYLAVGLTPDKTTFFLQSHIPALTELPMYYSNLVSIARLKRNPTVKAEMQSKSMTSSNVPVGFFTYPISQAADITSVNATIVPVGVDQLPMIEQTREIVRTFNRLYGKGKDVLNEPKAVLPDNLDNGRLVGTDGKAKMSKSLNNCIYLKDSEDVIKEKVQRMYTDPGHLKISDPGKTKGNPVFIYLKAFCRDEHFTELCPSYNNLQEMEEHYQKGGLGDKTVKKFLTDVLIYEFSPIYQQHKYWEAHIDDAIQILYEGTKFTKEITNMNLEKIRSSIGIMNFNKIKDIF